MTKGEAAALVARLIGNIHIMDAADLSGKDAEAKRMSDLAQQNIGAIVNAMTAQWNPIHTAPHGKRVLVYSAESLDCEVSEFHSGSWTPGELFDGEFTHWMPLPAPPAKNGA